MTERRALTGNEAAAEALRQVNPDVAAVYPITPQTELMHQFANFVANGQVDTEVILVESEHSAMSACVGAASCGARTITATSANGLALMWEIVYIASSYRLPIVMCEVNRALSGPINIHCDHSDTMGCRDSGWIQLYSESAQEAYDNTIQAFRIAEHPDVYLPTMATLDGFILSHTMEVLETIDDQEVKDFVGEYKGPYDLLDLKNPVTVGPLDLQDYYFEHKRAQVEAMRNAIRVIADVGQEFADRFGRSYGFYEGYQLDDAEVAVVAMGSTAGTAKAAVDRLREKGVKAGLLKIRVFRPFNGEALIKALASVKAVAVMDRSISFGLEGGPVFHELRSAAFQEKRFDLMFKPVIYGLGGRDINVGMVAGVLENLKKVADGEPLDPTPDFVGLRE